jgi:hypothetical protein
MSELVKVKIEIRLCGNYREKGLGLAADSSHTLPNHVKNPYSTQRAPLFLKFAVRTRGDWTTQVEVGGR